ncbi:MAG: short-chain dehydrogenase, partial [Actinomycetia bacterium]|nr:short-chain dehydrogenase [Actinomycetes bacterium]
LASTESADITGRVFDVTGTKLSISEGWHRGPTVEPDIDPTKLGPLVHELAAKARPNADMFGYDITPT